MPLAQLLALVPAHSAHSPSWCRVAATLQQAHAESCSCNEKTERRHIQLASHSIMWMQFPLISRFFVLGHSNCPCNIHAVLDRRDIGLWGGVILVTTCLIHSHGDHAKGAEKSLDLVPCVRCPPVYYCSVTPRLDEVGKIVRMSEVCGSASSVRDHTTMGLLDFFSEASRQEKFEHFRLLRNTSQRCPVSKP